MADESGGLLGLATVLPDIGKYFQIMNLLTDPNRPPITPDMIPDNFIQKIKKALDTMEGPIFNYMLQQAVPEIDAMTPQDVLAFVRGADGKPGLSKEQFVALFENNDGIGKVISEALEKKADESVIETLKNEGGFDLDVTGFVSDTSVLNKPLSDLGNDEFSNFVKGLNDDDTRKLLYQLPLENVREVIDALSKDEDTGERIKDFPVIELGAEPTREEIRAAIDKAIDARINEEDGFMGIFNVAGHVQENVFDQIRAKLGSEIQAKLNTGKEQLAKAQDAQEMYRFFTESPEEEVLAFITPHMDKIRAELKKPKNMTFLFDAWPEKFTDAGIEFIRSKLEQFPMIGNLIKMVLNFARPFLAKMGIDIDATPEQAQETQPPAEEPAADPAAAVAPTPPAAGTGP